MRKFRCVLPLSLALLLIAGCSKMEIQPEPQNLTNDFTLKGASAKNGPDHFVPFKGSFDVYIDKVTHIPPPPPKKQEVIGNGNVAHLGKTKVLVLQDWYPPHPPPLIPPYSGSGEGELIFTAANGDFLFAEYDDATGFHKTDALVYVSFTGHFNGGSGRFENAEGEFTWDGTYFPLTNSGYATVKGEIKY